LTSNCYGEYYDSNSRWLREARRRRGLHQHQLAAILDINPGRVSEWETGRKQILPGRLKQLQAILN